MSYLAIISDVSLGKCKYIAVFSQEKMFNLRLKQNEL